jgi:serine/threonine protein phosphatase PrpC
VTPRLHDDDTLPGDVVRALTGEVPVVGPAISSWAAASETGRGRHHNEDAWGQRDGDLFVVADGMGGRPGGAVAATAAVDALLDALDARTRSAGPVDWRRIMGRADAAVARAGRRAGHDRVGAAVAVLRVVDGRVVVAHAGDVRAYRLRGDTGEPVTRDHSVAATLEDAGLPPDAVPASRRDLMALTAFLGGGDAWRGFTVRMLDVRPGDRLVVCTDGVHRDLPLETWRRAGAVGSCQDLVDLLLAEAARAGGRDDRTALSVRFGGAR